MSRLEHTIDVLQSLHLKKDDSPDELPVKLVFNEGDGAKAVPLEPYALGVGRSVVLLGRLKQMDWSGLAAEIATSNGIILDGDELVGMSEYLLSAETSDQL